MNKTPPRQLILEAVITCIEKYGIENLTTRKIAEEAGTNIASINYYFRSKTDLVNETLTMTINHMLGDIFTMIDDSKKSFGEALQEIFFYLIDGAIRFPGISMAHLYDAVVEKRYDSIGGQAFVRVFERLAERAKKEYPDKDPEEIRFLLMQVFSSLMFTTISPGFFPISEKFRPIDTDHCRTLAEQYASVFLKTVRTPINADQR
jgi:AcrR family transcriptional regulator